MHDNNNQVLKWAGRPRFKVSSAFKIDRALRNWHAVCHDLGIMPAAEARQNRNQLLAMLVYRDKNKWPKVKEDLKELKKVGDVFKETATITGFPIDFAMWLRLPDTVRIAVNFNAKDEKEAAVIFNGLVESGVLPAGAEISRRSKNA